MHETVTLVGDVTLLCDPVWHVSYRIAVGNITNCYTRVTFLHLLYDTMRNVNNLMCAEEMPG